MEAPPAPIIKAELFNFDENAVNSPIKQERIDFETKLTFDTDDSCPGTQGNTYDGYTSESRETRINLKRRIVPYIKTEVKEEEAAPSTPKKRLISTSSTNSSPESKKFKEDQSRR